MLLAYMDESYSRRAMSVACVVLMDSQVVSLSRDLTDLAHAASRRFGDAPGTPEFHAYDLVGGRGDWLALRGQVRVRAWIYRKALEHEVDREFAYDGDPVTIQRAWLQERLETPFTRP